MNKFFLALTLLCATAQPLDAAKLSGVVKLTNYTKNQGAMTLDRFKDIIKEGNVIVKFYADWCNPCKQMATHVPALAQEFSNVAWMEVDIDMFRDLSSAFSIKSIPTLVFFQNGKEVAREVGGKTKKHLQDFIKRHFAIK